MAIRSHLFLFMLTAALLTGCGSHSIVNKSENGLPKEVTGLGLELPPLQVEGWVNGEGPTREELLGKVVVIESWASW